MENKVSQLVTQIVHLHEENIGSARATAERAVTIGVKLHQLKASIPHGEWLPFLETKMKSIPDRTARRYMTMATDRLIEERAFQLLEDSKGSDSKETKLATVANLKDGKAATGSDLEVQRESNFIPFEIREQAIKEMADVDWMKLPVTVKQLIKGINNREIGELYREYGITRQHQPKVYHPPKPMTIEEQIAAENATATAFLVTLHNACADVCMDLESKVGIIAVRVPLKELRSIRRQLARTNKLILAAMKLHTKSAKTSKALARKA